MKGKYADLCVMNADVNMIEAAGKLGWGSICLAREFKDVNSSKKFAEDARKNSGLEVYVGAIISGNVADNARKALEHADLIIAEGRSEEAFRQASESHEIDLILGAERYVEKDSVDFRGSGLDHVMMKFMSDNNVAYGIKFSDILNTFGSERIQLLGRIRQNIVLARKYKVPVVAVSGASSEYELRAPLEIASYLSFLGLGEQAVKAVSETPFRLIQKTKDRNNPDILSAGLKVTDWGGQQKKQKRKYGWY